jgi:hypothetical protein
MFVTFEVKDKQKSVVNSQEQMEEIFITRPDSLLNNLHDPFKVYDHYRTAI